MALVRSAASAGLEPEEPTPKFPDMLPPLPGQAAWVQPG